MNLETTVSTRTIPFWATSVVQVFTLAVLAYLAVHAWLAYVEAGEAQERNTRMLELVSTIRHHDEVLTMSARMAATTGELRWNTRYHEFAPELDAAFVELESLAKAVYETMHGPAAHADSANVRLVAMEERALQRVLEGDRDAAMNLLFSREYERQKRAYSEGTEQILQGIAEYVQDRHRIRYRRALSAVVLVLIAIPLEVLMWIVEIRSIRRATETM